MRMLRRLAVFACLALLAGLAESACARHAAVTAPPAQPTAVAWTAEHRTYVKLLELKAGVPPRPKPDEQRLGLVAVPVVLSPNIDLTIFRERVGLRFDIFANLRIDAIIDRVEPAGDGRRRVSAARVCEPPQTCGQDRVFLTVGRTGLSIYFRLPGVGDITVDRFGETDLLAIQHAASLPLRCAATAGWLPSFDVTRASPADVTSEIDVGVLYTRRALCGKSAPATCTQADLETLSNQLQNWTTQATETFQSSRVNANVNIVALEEISADEFTESQDLETDLKHLDAAKHRAGQRVLSFRRERAADVVIVLVSDAHTYNGLANIFPAWFPKSFANHATAVLVLRSAFTNHVMTHELGHVLGGGHERGNGRGRFWYSHGKVLKLGSGPKHTIMATGNNSRIDRFSSPDLRKDGLPTGTWHEDMVKTLNKTRRHVAAFQPRRTPPPRHPSSARAGDACPRAATVQRTFVASAALPDVQSCPPDEP